MSRAVLVRDRTRGQGEGEGGWQGICVCRCTGDSLADIGREKEYRGRAIRPYALNTTLRGIGVGTKQRWISLQPRTLHWCTIRPATRGLETDRQHKSRSLERAGAPAETGLTYTLDYGITLTSQ